MRNITWVVILSLLLLAAVIFSLTAPAPVNRDLIQADNPSVENILDLPTVVPDVKPHPRIDSSLAKLVDAADKGQAAAVARQHGIPFESDRARIAIEVQSGKLQSVVEAVKDFGGTIEAANGNLIQALIAPSLLETLSENIDIRFIRPPREAFPGVTIESMGLINASAWNSAGYGGSGIKIGVLDIGFAGYESLLGTELPSSVTPHWAPSGGPGSSVHGTACAEIIHDIAPDASLYFQNVRYDSEWAAAVQWLIDQEVDIISCSLAFLNDGPGDGTGPINDAVAAAASAGILWVNSAGNYAERHWMGTWNDPNTNDWHNFNVGDETNAISAKSGDTIWVGLRWDDPWEASDNDYDLYLFNSSISMVASSVNVQNGSQQPTELITYTATYTGNYHIGIANYSADGTSELHLFSMVQDFQYQNPEYSILQPADSLNAMTIGAVWYSMPTIIESYSSQGPTMDARIKPDIVALDGVSTASYGSNNFWGTSAAAPHVAGAAALIKERYPEYSKVDIQTQLEFTAVDLGVPGKDNVFGSGRLYLDETPPHPDTTIDPILDCVKELDLIGGSASCSYGTISNVEIRIQRGDDGYFWNGDDWQSGETWINTSPVDGTFDSAFELWRINTSTSPALPEWAKGSTYHIAARAVDDEAMPDLTPALESFFVGSIGWEVMETDTGDDLLGIWGNDKSNVFAVGGEIDLKNAIIEHYNGVTWEVNEQASGYYLENIWGSNASDVFAIGSSGTILHYNGNIWTSMSSGSSEDLWGIWGESSTSIFVTGWNGTILQYDGFSWNEMDSGTNAHLLGIWGHTSTDVFAVGMDQATGIILHYDGDSWTTMSSGVFPPLACIWGADLSDIFAAGALGTIIHYDGSEWSEIASIEGAPILATVWGSSESNVFVGGSDGTILYYQGNNWIPMYTGTTNFIRGIWGSNADIYAVGYRGTVLYYNSYPDNSVYITGPTTASQGDTVTLTIRVSKTTDLETGQISLQYDPGIITVQNVSNGLLYGDTNYVVPSSLNWTLNGSGMDNQGIVKIPFDLSGYGEPIGITEGILAVIDFYANGLNTSEVQFLPTSNLIDYYSSEISANWYETSVTIYEDRPYPITDLECETINHSTIRLTWTAMGIGGGEYDIRYRPETVLNEDRWDYSSTIKCTGEPVPKTALSPESFDVTGLDHNTNYYFAIKVRNPDSLFSDISNPTGCTTDPWYHGLNISIAPPEGGSAEGAGTELLHGTSYDIVATPAECYHFVSWSGETTTIANASAAATTILMNDDYSITANFAIDTFTLTYNSDANGSILGDSPQTVDCGSSGSAVTAVPDDCYHFVNWSDSSTANPRTDTNVTGDITVTANFAIDTFTLTYNAGANGSISGDSPQIVDCGSSGSAVEAIPDPCYHFVNWSDSSTANPRTDTNVTGDITVTANFAIDTFTLTYNSGANGSILGDSPQTVDCGSSGSPVTAVPDDCYHFVNWSDLSTANPRTDTNVTGDITVTANFAIDTFTLTYNAGANGSISGDSPQIVDCGSSGSAVEAIPAPCYHFVNWSDSSTANPRTDTNVTGDITVTANFAIDTFTLTYNAGANGSITGTTPQIVDCGSSGSAVTAVPDDCYHFVNWSDASTDNPRTDTNITGDITVTANFALGGPFYLEISVNGDGSVTDPGTGIHGPYNCSEIVNLLAEPELGYNFISWSGDADTVDNRFSPSTYITINGNYSIAANFGLEPVGCYGDVDQDDTFGIEDYSLLRLMLFLRYPVHPGGDTNADGWIGIEDYSALRLILFGRQSCIPRYETTYDFLSGADSNKWAKSKTISSIPPADNYDNDSGWIDATAGNYEDIALTDSNVWTIAGAPGLYSALQCKFTVVNNPSDITSIGITLDGSSGIAGSTLRFYAWNFNTESWTQIGTGFTMTAGIASYNAWTAWGQVYSNYIDGSQHMYLLAALNTVNADLNVDYIKLTVAYP